MVGFVTEIKKFKKKQVLYSKQSTELSLAFSFVLVWIKKFLIKVYFSIFPMSTLQEKPKSSVIYPKKDVLEEVYFSKNNNGFSIQPSVKSLMKFRFRKSSSV